MKRIICIGHITKDKIITPSCTNYCAGGTAFYFAHALKSLSATSHFELVTKGNKEIEPAVLNLREQGVNILWIPCEHTVYFENKYGNNPNERHQRVLAEAEPFSLDDMEKLSASIIHVGALLHHDFSTETLEHLAQKGKLSIDAQGFLRQLKGEQVLPIAWKGAKKVLSFTHTLKVNEEEMEMLSGLKEPYQAAQLFAEWGVKEVVITLGSEGSLIYSDGMFYPINVYHSEKVIDVTGCGDTYMACYLYARSEGKSILESGNFASAMCGKKVEHLGALTVEDVKQIISTYGYFLTA